jgi:hypothetical protein
LHILLLVLEAVVVEEATQALITAVAVEEAVVLMLPHIKQFLEHPIALQLVQDSHQMVEA